MNGIRRWVAALAAVLALKTTPLSAAPEEAIVEVTINGRIASPETLMLRDGPRFFASIADLGAWRIALPAAAPTVRDGVKYLPIDAIDGIGTSYDSSSEALTLKVPSRDFTTHVLGGITPDHDPSLMRPAGAFLNYDIRALNEGGFADEAAQLQGDVFTPGGNARFDYLLRDDGGRPFRERIGTSWTHDDVDHLTTTTFGDAVYPGTLLSAPARFFGISFASNTTLDPFWRSSQRPSFSGLADTDSLVDVRVNGTSLIRSDVPQGPFLVSNIAQATGLNDVELVVRDTLGQEHLVAQSLYVAPQLLRRGVTQFDIGTGLVRQGFGTRADSYGPFAGFATMEKGFSPNLSAGASLTLGGAGSGASIIGDLLIGHAGVVEFGGGYDGTFGNHLPQGTIGFESIQPHFNVGFSLVSGSAGPLDQLQVAGLNINREMNVHAGLQIGRYDSVNVSYSTLAGGQIGATGTANIGWQHTTRRRTFSVRLFAARGAASSSGILVNVSGGSGAVSTSEEVGYQDGAFAASLDVAKSVPIRGFGYDIGLGQGPNEQSTAAAYYRSPKIDVDAAAASVGGATLAEVEARGAVAWLDHGLYALEPVQRSFAVVDVPGFPNVRVDLNGAEVGRTDSGGKLTTTSIQPYRNNEFSIEPLDLPLTASTVSLQQLNLPALSGRELRFDVHVERGIFAKFIDGNGRELPAGSIVRSSDVAEHKWLIGNDGRAYLDGVVAGKLTVRIDYMERTCTAALDVPKDVERLPSIGSVVCR